jgi:hypothetical protein
MTSEELSALQERIDTTPGLKTLESNLKASLIRLAEQNGYGLDPFTILFIISIILQVIQLCQKNRSDADITLDMVNADMLPPRKLMRLKRRLNVLWRKHCSERGTEPGSHNPFFAAAVSAVKATPRNEVLDIVQSSN